MGSNPTGGTDFGMTDEKFIEICNNSSSMLEASKKVDMKFSTFKRKAERLSCYRTNQFWSKGKNALSDSRIKSKYSNELFCEESPARREYIKRLIINNSLIEYKCKECGIENTWNGKILSLHLDHINGVRNDNRLENLRFLCPNCHSQTETYCIKNKNGGNTIGSFSKEIIIDCISNSKTITDVINKLGLKDTKSNRTSIKSILQGEKLKFA